MHTRPTENRTPLADARQECNDVDAQVRAAMLAYRLLACAVFCGGRIDRRGLNPTPPLWCRLRLGLAVCSLARTGESVSTAKRVRRGRS